MFFKLAKEMVCKHEEFDVLREGRDTILSVFLLL